MLFNNTFVLITFINLGKLNCFLSLVLYIIECTFYRVIKPEESLIKPSDLEKEGEVLEEYAKLLCEKFDSVKKDSKTTKFFPYKTLNSSKVEEKVKRKSSGRWEVTAATPPVPVHGDTKLVSLQESIQLQSEQQHKLKVSLTTQLHTYTRPT